MKRYMFGLLKVRFLLGAFFAAFFLVLMSTTVTANDVAPVYRFWSSEYQHHFYTISEAEKDFVIANDPNWAYEGESYNAYTINNSERIAVYRFYSPIFQGHFYTSSVSERDAIIINDPKWNYEGLVYYVKEEGSPVYRFYSKAYDGHFYTTSLVEKEHLEATDPNWVYEGVAFYVEASVAPSSSCGADHQRTLSVPPTDLCTSPTYAVEQTGSGPWQWACANPDGSIASLCLADSTTSNTVVVSVCGSAVNTCTVGTFVDTDDSSTQSHWGCVGSGGFGTFAECSVNK